jgi:putative ATP-dependent endonuclease of OLD family
MNETVKKIARQQLKTIADVLGRLSEKYKVSVSAPEFNPSRVPLAITLGEDSIELEQWGSGTRNRTKILLTLFRARRVTEQETSASKVTPVTIIEEPESFLHPSAQAEFGSMIQDLAEEFAIQVIAATHSPYMLSTKSRACNLLLRRSFGKRMTFAATWTELAAS